MKGSQHLLFLAFLAIGLFHGIRAEEKVSDPFADESAQDVAKGEAALAEIGKGEPDHLLPLDPNPGDWHVRYTDQLRKRLDLESPFYCQMQIHPSFSAESVISLTGELGWGGKPEDEKKLTLRYSIGDKSIWYSMPENNEEKVQKEVKVETKSVEFPKAQGVKVYKLWDRMIGRVRYPEGGVGGLDGVTYEFATRRGQGEVWMPRARKSPLLFVELGHSLIEYCKVPDEKSVEALKEIDAKIDQLEKYLDQHPVKLE